MSLRELGLLIADHGRWEEFHQRRHEYVCCDWHKARRLELERRYRAMKKSSPG